MNSPRYLFSAHHVLIFAAALTLSQYASARTQTLSAKLSESIYYSAVSPEFPNGLHTQFLKYIARNLNIQLSIGAMPYARRILELEKGKIDFIVGLSDVGDIPANCVRIYPAYESMTTSLFTTRKDLEQLKTMTSLEQQFSL